MKISGTNIEMVRGDTEQLTVSREDADGTQIPFEVGDTVYFTVKVDVHTEDIILQKTITSFTDGKAIVVIDPADTSSLDYGSYMYDVQVTEADTSVTTIIWPSRFRVSGEVTYD